MRIEPIKHILTKNIPTYRLPEIFGKRHLVLVCTCLILSIILTPALAESTFLSKPQADLRADVNRDGIVHFGNPYGSSGDKKSQGKWSIKRGAIVLPNLDDDANRCNERFAIQKESVTACNDAKDTVINGREDIEDLAPLHLMPWYFAPENSSGRVVIGSSAATKTRLFAYRYDGWKLWTAQDRLTAAELRNGVSFRLEAIDVVRDKRRWDGTIDVYAIVSLGKLNKTDHVQFHVAPLILQNDLMSLRWLYLPGMPPITDAITNAAALANDQAAQPVFPYLSIRDAARPSNFGQHGIAGSNQRAQAYTGLFGSAYKAFHDDFTFALSEAQPSARYLNLSTFEDPWIQDMFEMAFAAMPRPEGRFQVMYLALRSPQAWRFSAQKPLVQLLGPNIGIVEQWADLTGSSPASGEFSSNSTGNFGAIPPYSHKGRNYPLGRVIYGAGKAWVGQLLPVDTSNSPGQTSIAPGGLRLIDRYPDKTFVRMLADQDMQKPLIIDSAWLAVGHIDEIVAFVPAGTRRGWKVVVADPVGAWNLLVEMVNKGQGDTKFLSGLGRWKNGIDPAEYNRTVSAVVRDKKLRSAQLTAQAKISSVINVLKTEAGIKENEIIQVPVLFQSSFYNDRSFTALTPNAANLVTLSRNAVAIAKQHGPWINSADVFQKAAAQALAGNGIKVYWVEDYIQAHGGVGEIHCQSNTLRHPGGAIRWWNPDKFHKNIKSLLPTAVLF